MELLHRLHGAAEQRRLGAQPSRRPPRPRIISLIHQRIRFAILPIPRETSFSLFGYSERVDFEGS